MGLLKSIQNSALAQAALTIASHSPLYEWAAGQPDIPERLQIKPIDPWRGDSARGRAICEGRFELPHGYIFINPQDWSAAESDPAMYSFIHGFEWLRDLRTLSGGNARAQARTLTHSWLRLHHKPGKGPAWDAPIMAKRLSMWLSHFEYLETDGQDEEFHELYFTSLIRQAGLLRKAALRTYGALDRLHILKSRIYCAICLNQPEWLAEAVERLSTELDAQIFHDGGHISRSPDRLLRALQILIDIRTLFAASTQPVPEALSEHIAAMVQALKFFRYQDKRFALFAGTQEGDSDTIDTILAQAGVRAKAVTSLPQSGYEKITQGRGTLLIDTGPKRAMEYSGDHQSPLAFEFCYGRERFFVSCGDHPSCPEWQNALRQTPAHSTLTLNNLSATPFDVECEREDAKEHTILQASHDGYMKALGFTHHRMLYLAKNGQDLRGEDRITADMSPQSPVDIAIRFHLHPDVRVSLIREGQEALLKLKNSSIGWRFHHSAGLLSLENSIYLGQGTQPRKTKQLVINGQTTAPEAAIKWALRKEG